MFFTTDYIKEIPAVIATEIELNFCSIITPFWKLRGEGGVVASVDIPEIRFHETRHQRFLNMKRNGERGGGGGVGIHQIRSVGDILRIIPKRLTEKRDTLTGIPILTVLKKITPGVSNGGGKWMETGEGGIFFFSRENDSSILRST